MIKRFRCCLFGSGCWGSEKISFRSTCGDKTNFNVIFTKKKDSLLAIHLKSIDTVYYNALVEMEKLDQSDRDPRNNKRFYNDSLNFEKLILLSTEKGFPTYQKTGSGCNIAGLLLWHHRDSYPNSNQWQRIIPLIKKEIFKGTFDPEYFKRFDEAILKN